MPVPDKQLYSTDPVVREKMQRLIIGRVALISMLLAANWMRTGALEAVAGRAGAAGADGEGNLFVFFGLTMVLSAGYLMAVRFAGGLLWQARIQFLFDAVLITWLVWRTGDLISPYITLYIVLISVAGFFLSKTETLVLAIGCSALFTALSTLVAQDVLWSISGEQPAMRVVQIVGVNNVAILLVGLLSARLAERRRISEQLRHTEESFADLHILHERIVESIGSGLVTTDLDGRIYAFNRAAEKISGIPAAEAIGSYLPEIFGEGVRRPVRQCLRPGGESRVSPAEFEANFAKRNGQKPHYVTAAFSVVPLLGKTGETTGLIMTFNDITHLKALEATVRRSDRLAAVGRMAAGLAHELRNPIGSMSSALQFLQDRGEGNGHRPAEDTALMKVVLNESDRLNSIITSFLAFARPAANGLAAEGHAAFDLGAAIGDCIALIRHSPDVCDRHLFKFDPPAEPLAITGNETQLKQVMWNLARNAIEAMPEGGRLSVALEDAGRKRIRMIFTDTGRGIDEEIREHLFEPFTSGRGGTGLGLSIVHTIVEDHGGRIDVESDPGKGTRIAVELPTGA
jgi:two-component system sensor histidine kinase PilS (NtrC family)